MSGKGLLIGMMVGMTNDGGFMGDAVMDVSWDIGMG